MFSFFKRKKSSDDKNAESAPLSDVPESAVTSDEEQTAATPVDKQSDDTASVVTADDAVVTAPPTVDDVVEPDDAHDGAVVSTDESAGSEDQSGTEVTAATREAVDDAPQAPAKPHLPETEDTVAMPDKTTDPAGSVESVESVEPVESAEPAEPVKKADEARGSWLSRLRKGLSRTGQSIGGLFVDVKLDEDLYEELETALITADAGMEATTKLLDELRTRVRKDRLTDAMQARAALRDILTEHLKPLEKTFPIGTVKPLVMMIAGVNGAGKTTSIGKLANTFQQGGGQVLLAAGDTFRAAAREQLVEWGNRNNVTVIAQEGGDPAAVAFDAVNAGRARQADVVMIDTAGRLPTQLHLMEELKKIKRVVTKADGNAPHEVLLVVDGNSGQNVIAQIRAFDAAIGLTGLVVTKLDGTAKGGILAAVAAGSQGVRPVPVYWIGVGEGIHDLQPFAAHEFSAALIGDAGHAVK